MLVDGCGWLWNVVDGLSTHDIFVVNGGQWEIVMALFKVILETLH